MVCFNVLSDVVVSEDQTLGSVGSSWRGETSDQTPTVGDATAGIISGIDMESRLTPKLSDTNKQKKSINYSYQVKVTPVCLVLNLHRQVFFSLVAPFIGAGGGAVSPLTCVLS